MKYTNHVTFLNDTIQVFQKQIHSPARSFKNSYRCTLCVSSRNMSGKVRVHTRRGPSDSDAIRSRMSVDKNAMKESGPRPDSTHRLPTAAFSERLCDADISKKEFNENVRNLLLHKQLYTPPVFGS